MYVDEQELPYQHRAIIFVSLFFILEKFASATFVVTEV
jgi:hypothetical protein